jgi:hypothetical protein
MTAEERTKALSTFGFTDRQARFLTTAMLHAGVCLGRQYCTFAGIRRGQVMHDFFADLMQRGYATAYKRAHRKTHLYHIHGKALYQALGEPNNRNRRLVPLPRAVERVMLLDAVIARPDVVWLATEREKVAHFTREGRLRPLELPHLTFGNERGMTIRYFPDKLPIGIDRDGRTHLFLYLVTRRQPVDFRAFLHRHAEVLRTLSKWRIRLLFPRHLAAAVDRYRAALRDELATPLQSTTLDELRWFFEQRLKAATVPAVVGEARFQQAQEIFGTPRFRVLYRAWLRYGDAALYATLSPVLADALAQRSGELECHVLPHPYQHLASLAGTA